MDDFAGSVGRARKLSKSIAQHGAGTSRRCTQCGTVMKKAQVDFDGSPTWALICAGRGHRQIIFISEGEAEAYGK